MIICNNKENVKTDIKTEHTKNDNTTIIPVILEQRIYLFIYYANNQSRQTRDLKSSTNCKNKLDTKTNKNEQCLVTGMECS